MSEKKNTGISKMIPINLTDIVVILVAIAVSSSALYVVLDNQNDCRKQEDQVNYVKPHWWSYCGDIDFR